MPLLPIIKPRIDVHMLRYMEPTEWYRECCASLAPAFPVIDVHQIQGFHEQIGRGRALGFMQGSATYVSHVDPDDIYNPDAFAICADYMDERPLVHMVYTSETCLHPDGTQSRRRTPMDITRVLAEPSYCHGLRVYRRDAVMPHLDLLRNARRYCEWELVRAIIQSGGRVAHIDVQGRQWRMHGDQAHRWEQRLRDHTGPLVGS